MTKRLPAGTEPNLNAKNSLLTLNKAGWKITRLKRQTAMKDQVFNDGAPIGGQEIKFRMNMKREVELSYRDCVTTDQNYLLTQINKAQLEEV